MIRSHLEQLPEDYPLSELGECGTFYAEFYLGIVSVDIWHF